MTEKQLHVRVSEEEMKKLERYAKKSKRTKTDVVREFLRSLP
ncbi:ribbon-helix-helix protein, CopG family [Phormidesmis sp. 146-12]